MSKQTAVEQTLVFILLVAVAVVGRLTQPDWNFSPMTAVALFAGFFFVNRLVAIMVPVLAMLISNFYLPAYTSTAVMVTVYLSFMIAAYLGKHIQQNRSKARFGILALFPAVMFFLLTNFAVWAFENNYPHTLAGLALCYQNALLFFRSMLSGDILYIGMIFGSYMLCEKFGW